MKVENMVKLKEEFDYKSLSRRLDIELDKLIAENERQRKYFDDEVERIRVDAQRRIAEAEKSYKIALEVLFSLSLSHTHTPHICCNSVYGHKMVHCVMHVILSKVISS
jgi:hypothetical protein